MEKVITITMNPEKVATNSVRFAEVLDNEFLPAKIGTLYVQKSALSAIGHTGGSITVEIGIGGDIKMMPEKVTKNAVRFMEETVSEYTPAKIGTLYVPKSTLAELGYAGDALYVTIKIAK